MSLPTQLPSTGKTVIEINEPQIESVPLPLSSGPFTQPACRRRHGGIFPTGGLILCVFGSLLSADLQDRGTGDWQLLQAGG